MKRGEIKGQRQDVNGTYYRIVQSTIYLYPSEKLGALVTAYSGGTPSKSGEKAFIYWNGDIPWVSPKDFKHFFIYDSEDHISEYAVQDSATQKVPANSVLVVVRSGILKHTLPIAINKVEVTINQDIKVLRPNNHIMPEYLGHYLNVFQKRILNLCVKHSTTVQSINTYEFFNMRIPVPAIAKQKKLSTFMGKSLQRYKNSLQQADEYISGIFDFVLDSLHFSVEPSKKIVPFATSFANIGERIDVDYYSPKFTHFRRQIESSVYPAVYIGSMSTKIISGFAAGKQDQADDMPENQRVPHLRPFSITPAGELSFKTKKYVPKYDLHDGDYCKKNEVLFNNTNSPELLGKTTVFDADMLCAVSNHITRITLKKEVNPYYVSAFFNVLRSIGYWKLLCTKFNNQAGVNIETLEKVKIPLPDRTLQDKIANGVILRQKQAVSLRKQAEQEWTTAKQEFEKELLGE